MKAAVLIAEKTELMTTRKKRRSSATMKMPKGNKWEHYPWKSKVPTRRRR